MWIHRRAVGGPPPQPNKMSTKPFFALGDWILDVKSPFCRTQKEIDAKRVDIENRQRIKAITLPKLLPIRKNGLRHKP